MAKVVGILSMQRVVNYGSFLQAYALKQLLLSAGAGAVHFIDIEPGRQLPGFNNRSVYGKIKAVGRCLRYLAKGTFKDVLRGKRFLARLGVKFQNEYYPLLGLQKENPGYFDLVVIGSDEVFNCCQASPWGFTSQLFGNIRNADKVVSYAGSFGHTSLKQIYDLGLDKEIRENLLKLSAISVRDLNSFSIVEKLIGEPPVIHLDPVLLYDYSEIMNRCESPWCDDYLLVYSYQGRIHSQHEILHIKNYAEDHGLKLVSIFADYAWVDEVVVPATPFDVLRWFRCAESVITDTFHGTIMSIITKRRFCTIIRDSNNEKLTTLLECLMLIHRGCKDIVRMNGILDEKPDFGETDKIIARERTKTQVYLKSALDF